MAKCIHCLADPGNKSRTSVVWKGFKDGDTGELVCFACRSKHYRKKFKSPATYGLYSELPVINVQPQLTLHFNAKTI